MACNLFRDSIESKGPIGASAIHCCGGGAEMTIHKSLRGLKQSGFNFVSQLMEISLYQNDDFKLSQITCSDGDSKQFGSNQKSPR